MQSCCPVNRAAFYILYARIKIVADAERDPKLKKARSKLFGKLARHIPDERVIRAMRSVPRERFVSPDLRHLAYLDIPLAIGGGQTISQPYMVALMTRALHLSSRDRVLEVGTGSGYHSAVLAELAREGIVVTVERLPELAQRAWDVLEDLGYRNVVVEPAGEVLGCPERGPYDAILVAAATPALPPSLLAQLAPGGRMAAPVGTLEQQELVQALKTGEGLSISMLGPCRFVPLYGAEAFSPNG